MKYYLYLFVLLASIFGGAQGAWAEDPAGHPFCKNGFPTMEVLAVRVEHALALDKPTETPGMHALEDCRATPQHLYAGIKAHNPDAKLASVQDLPRYLRENLVEVTLGKDAHITSDCLWSQANGTLIVKQNCAVDRPLKAGEKVYKDKDTDVLTIKSGCANTGVITDVVVTAPHCYRVEFPSFKGRPTRIAYMGRSALPDYCTWLNVAGVSARFYDMPEECPAAYTKEVADAQGRKRMVKVVCSWAEVEAHSSQTLGYPAKVQNISGSFYGRVNDATNVMYLPKEALDGEFWVCYDGDNASFGVVRSDYDDHTHTAVISRELVLQHQ